MSDRLDRGLRLLLTDADIDAIGLAEEPERSVHRRTSRLWLSPALRWFGSFFGKL